MPKEKIRNKEGLDIELRWSNNECGQLGIVGASTFKFENGEESDKLFFTFCSRKEYNDTIRLLRRVRDQVWGKDE